MEAKISIILRWNFVVSPKRVQFQQCVTLTFGMLWHKCAKMNLDKVTPLFT